MALPESCLTVAPDWIVALATLGLVGITYWYARLTRDISRHSAETARQASETVEAMNRQMLLSRRPEVMPNRKVTSRPLVDDPGVKGVAPRYAPMTFETSLSNVGLGPALNVWAILHVDTEIVHPRDELFKAGGYLGVDAEPPRLVFEFSQEAIRSWLGRRLGGRLELSYRDIFDGEWEVHWDVAYWHEEFELGERTIVKAPYSLPR